MDVKKHTTPEALEQYSFLWSQARLIVASVALFLGGIPPIMFLFRFSSFYSTISSFLTIAWLLSGVASGYMLYRWNADGKTLFGKKLQHDKIAFFVSIVTGFNLGLTGLIGRNIGMSITMNSLVFTLTGVIYLITATYLFKRWHESGKKIFFAKKKKTEAPVEDAPMQKVSGEEKK